MLPDRVSNPGPLTYESGALPTALRGPASKQHKQKAKISALFIADGWLPGYSKIVYKTVKTIRQ